MLHNMKIISLHRVFHGIRFKVNKVDCRETINFFCIYPSLAKHTFGLSRHLWLNHEEIAALFLPISSHFDYIWIIFSPISEKSYFYFVHSLPCDIETTC